jgi:putative CocE/NonD family hydrolase
MIHSIRIDRNVPMTMRDGVTLRADIYRPDDGGKYPAVVIRTPYNKALAASYGYFPAVRAAFEGYAVVIQDTRGRFASEGEFLPMAPEGPDGYDTVEIVAAEPWCDGNVGMAGGSYLGRVQWEAAMEQPPHLKAIAPAIISSGPLSETRRRGLVDLESSISWFGAMAMDMIDKMAKAGKDTAEMRRQVGYALLHLEEVCRFLPMKDLPYFRFEGLSEGFTRRIGNEVLAQLKSEEDLFWKYEKVKVPCFHAGGWYDLFVGGLFENFMFMREKGGSAEAREGQHVLCGPWAHETNLTPFVGGLNFGPNASGAAAFAFERHLAFFNRYLKGMESPYLVPVRYFVMGLNRWRNADTWPLPETVRQRFFLRSKGRANSAAGDGTLSPDPPASEPPDRYLYDPQFPVPTKGGRNLPAGFLVPGPLDQTPLERRHDVLCYSTPELSQDLEITGPLSLHLFASTQARDTDFTAKLTDVYPDGTSINVAEGCIRARFRKSVLKPEWINPGEIVEYVIDLGATSIVFKKGHRMRLDITSSNFPRIDRNLNTGNPFGEDAEGIPVIQTVYHQREYPSYLDLPVIPKKG